jgi:hypothetical protein
MEKLYKIKEVAEYLGVKRLFVERAIKSINGKPPLLNAIVINGNNKLKGSEYRIKESEIERFLNSWDTTNQVRVGDLGGNNNGNESNQIKK